MQWTSLFSASNAQLDQIFDLNYYSSKLQRQLKAIRSSKKQQHRASKKSEKPCLQEGCALPPELESDVAKDNVFLVMLSFKMIRKLFLFSLLLRFLLLLLLFFLLSFYLFVHLLLQQACYFQAVIIQSFNGEIKSQLSLRSPTNCLCI